MTEQQKSNEIARITQQLAALREKVNHANAETKVHVEKRDKLNEEFKKLHQEIHELKNERNNLNEKVKTLKQQRDEARTRIRANIKEVKTHSPKITELKKKTPKTTDTIRDDHSEIPKILYDWATIHVCGQALSYDLSEI